MALALVVILGALPPAARAQDSSSAPAEKPAAASSAQDAQPPASNLPVSLDRIKDQLAHPPAQQLRGLDARPTFKVEVQEHRKLEDLVASLDFKSGPRPAGGLTANEMQRVQFPSVDNPLRQPYAAFSQPELSTILIENLVGKYLVGRGVETVTNDERALAETAAKEEVQQAIVEYCAAQPNRDTITLCKKPQD